MSEKKPRGSFTLSHEELASREMVLTAFTMLESRGYGGLTELFAILDDPTVILKLVRFLSGTSIKLPPIEEFSKCLKASQYAFCDMHKRVNNYLPVKGSDIRQFMNISKEEENELLEIFDNWAIYMNKQGHDIRNYMHINRTNTTKRIDLVTKGKKWSKKVY
jgi:hypothetical protein